MITVSFYLNDTQHLVDWDMLYPVRWGDKVYINNKYYLIVGVDWTGPKHITVGLQVLENE